MNCKKFEEMLELYMIGELQEDLKLHMDEHLMDCEKCNEIYNEELFIKAAVLDAMDLDNVVFESQKDKIMNRIDKNKYCGTTNNNKFEISSFIKYFKLGAPIAAAIILVLLLNPIDRFKIFENSANSTASGEKGSVHTTDDIAINDSESSKAEVTSDSKAGIALNNAASENKSIEDEKASIKDTAKNTETSLNKESNSQVVEVENNGNSEGSLNNSTTNNPTKDPTIVGEQQGDSNPIENSDANNQENPNDYNNSIYYEKETDVNVRFDKKLYMDDSIATISNGWVESPNKQFESLIKVNDAYLDKIYIRDTGRNIVWSMEKEANVNNSTPKFVEWYDDENIFVVMNGTEDNVKKEELYLLNINKGNSTMLYRSLGGSKSIVGINKINTNNVELKLQLNSNDNYLSDGMQSFTLLDLHNNNFYK